MLGKFLDPKNDIAFKKIFGNEKNKDKDYKDNKGSLKKIHGGRSETYLLRRLKRLV